MLAGDMLYHFIEKITFFPQVVRFPMYYSMGPPFGLGLFGVALGAWGGSWGWLASIVRVFDLFARLDEPDKCLGDDAAVDLLEVIEGAFIIIHNLPLFSNSERD
jgi:hypothetical protein